MYTRLTPFEFSLTKEKIDKINARAVKRGFTGRLELTGTEVTVTEHNDLGLDVETVYIDAELTGSAPSYGGWTFLASLESLPAEDGSVNWVVSCAPGVSDSQVDRSTLIPGHCAHCEKVSATRRKLYLVERDGDIRQVGSTCIKDFLGWSAMPVWLDQQKQLDDALERIGTSTETSYSPRTVLLAALAASREFGFIPVSEGGRSTARLARILLEGTAPSVEDLIDMHAAAAHLEAVAEQVDEKLELVRSGTSGATFGYLANLHAAASSSHVTSRSFALLCSAVSYLHRLQVDAERKAEEAAREHKPVPTGNRIQVEATVLNVRYQDSDYGPTVKMLLEGDGWRLWGTCPRALMDALGSEEGTSGGWMDELIGKRVIFFANVTANPDDESFGYFSRPTKAAILP